MPSKAVELPKSHKDPELRTTGRAVKPKDAATLIILRRDEHSQKILMPKRAARHKFMPNNFVFPGARLS